MPGAGSPEFRIQARFHSALVELLHEMGAYEFARQYEWSREEQPNCLKLSRPIGP